MKPPFTFPLNRERTLGPGGGPHPVKNLPSYPLPERK